MITKNKKFWFKFVKNRQKIIQKHWYILDWIHNSYKKNDDYKNIYSANPLYLIVNTADGHIAKKMELNT